MLIMTDPTIVLVHGAFADASSWSRLYAELAGDGLTVAILVADEWQHRGLARQLLRPLAERARSAGIERFRAEIQADNAVARRFFLGLTPTADERHRNGDVVVLIDVAELLRMVG
jgi:GNAT superfamily N-acetyltransferase